MQVKLSMISFKILIILMFKSIEIYFRHKCGPFQSYHKSMLYMTSFMSQTLYMLQFTDFIEQSITLHDP